MSRIWVIWLCTLMLSQASSETVVLTPRERIEGKKLYQAKCAKCHRLREPADYSTEEWQLWFGKMSRKAKLKPAQEKLLSRYLDAYRSQKGPSKDRRAEERPTIFGPVSARGQATQPDRGKH